MSGYTDDAIGHHGILEAGVNFLQKPFSDGQPPAEKCGEVLKRSRPPPSEGRARCFATTAESTVHVPFGSWHARGTATEDRRRTRLRSDVDVVEARPGGW